MNKVLSVALFAIIAIGSAIAAQGSADAVGCGVLNNPHLGYLQADTSLHQYEGVRANVVVRYSTLCTGDSSIGNFSNSYVAIANGNSVGNDGWVQAGFETNPPNGAPLSVDFYQIYRGQGLGLQTAYSTTSINVGGATQIFKVVYNTNCGGCLNIWWNSTPIAHTTWSPLNYWTYPYSVEYSAETGYAQDSVPGTSTAPVLFSTMQAERFSDDTFESLPCHTLGFLNDNSANWYLSPLNGCSSFSLYQK